MFISMFTSLLLFNIVAVKSSHTLVFMSPHFSFSFFSKCCGMPFHFGLRVLHLFVVLVLKLQMSWEKRENYHV